MSISKKDTALLAKKEKKVKLQKAEECYKKGIELYHKAKTQDDFGIAAESYSVAISLRPNNPKYYYARGNTFSKMGEMQRAFFDYSASIRLDAQCAQYYTARGTALRKLGQSAEAIHDYTMALKLDPSNGNNYFNRALVFYETGAVERAIADYTLAAEDERYSFRAYYNRGNCYRKMGCIDDSIADLKRAVDLDPTNPAGHNNLGLSMFEGGQFSQAQDAFSSAISSEVGQKWSTPQPL